jgi:hypothetical protein
MAVIEWDKLDERYYYSGVDRGIIDLPGVALVPWNGLISVDVIEADIEEVRSVFDGRIYVNQHFGGFFEAKIKAFTFPPGMGAVMGHIEPYPGLNLTAQTRASFNFSFRTMINTDEGYRLHLVYNAMAPHVDKQSETISDDPDAEIFEWIITTLPPKPVMFKPTAHIVINSPTTDPAVLSEIEDLLYGTVSTDPQFPSQMEVFAIFEP